MTRCRAVAFVVVLLAAACRAPFTPTDWTSTQESTIAQAIDKVSEAEIRSIFADIDGVRHVTVAGDNLSVYESRIVSRFRALDLTTSTAPVTIGSALHWTEELDRITYVYGEFTMNNIIADRTGTDPSLAPILMTGHWDSVPTGPGINDNGSAIACLLEAGRVLQGVSLKRTIRFILFAFEEEGLHGAYAYATSMDRTPHAVINLDTIAFTSPQENVLPLTDVLLGFPTTGDFIGVFATDFSGDVGMDYCRAADSFVPTLKYYFALSDNNFANNPFLTDLLRSDHTPFWEQRIPAVFITDTAELRVGSPYHTVEDTIESIDFPFMIDVIKAAIATLCLQAGVVE